MLEVFDKVPALVEKLTRPPATPLPASSSSRAEIVAWPPVAGSACGLAVTTIWEAAAEPSTRSSVALAPPENAVTVAPPFNPLAEKCATARPFWVWASDGSSVPAVVVKVTTVPSWTGVPAPGLLVVLLPVPLWVPPLSINTAITSSWPVVASGAVRSVMTVPEGATSGTRWQARPVAARRPAAIRAK